MLKSNYTKPKVCEYKSEWFVYFRYEGKLKRYKYGLNYIKDLSKRRMEANRLVSFLLEKLKNGWNPLIEVEATKEEMTLIEALNFALDKKKNNISKKSFLGYRNSIKFFCEAVDFLSLQHLTIQSTKRVHIKTIFDKCKDIRSWSNKAYNKNLSYISAVLVELIQWDIIESNPSTKIKRLSTQDTEYHKPPTDKEFLIIQKHIKSKCYNFLNFIHVIYSCGIRPNEILQIKIKDINFERSEFNLRAETTKTRKSRTIPINNDLMQVIIRSGAKMCDKNYYLFGSFRVPNKGNSNIKESFHPAPTQIKRDTATRLWEKLVKKQLGLNITMYSIKHKGSNDMLRSGIDLDTIRHIFGHSNKRTTLIYAKEVTEVYRNEIMNNFPKFMDTSF